MLSDRPYMRNDYPRERTPFLVWLLSALIAGFVVNLIATLWLKTSGFENLTILSVAGLKNGHAWTLLTYPFVHRNVLHLLGVGLALFFIGRELADQVGERRLAWLAAGAAAAGGLAWAALHFQQGGELVGASTVLWCYFTIFACLYPNREISFLIFFVLPITTRPKYIAAAMLGIDLLGLVLTELPGDRIAGYDVPHSAHLAAIAVGWLYYRYFHQARWLALRPRAADELRPGARRAAKVVEAELEPAEAPAAPTRADLRAEVDRILDKINSHGFGALTPEEKRVLDNARDTLSQR